MTYQQTLDWLFNQLPAYQKIGKSAYKTDLSNIIKLSKYLGNPHLKFKTIHVAGTNGKGSSSHMLASVLQEAGYQVGLYTSPHLKDFRERIKLNGKDVSKQYVIQFIKKHRIFFKENQLSFFEMTVGMAFDYFVKKKVDIAIIEVGLGGRLDSTNIITPIASLITNIGIDHTAFLGNTLKQIASEKAGIIKKGVPVIISETQSETKLIFIAKAKKEKAKIVFADKIVTQQYATDLLGDYQQKNIKGVVATLHSLSEFSISEKQISNGLQNVVKNTQLLGRWQVLQQNPTLVCDTAHNTEGLLLTMKQLKQQKYAQLHIVLGVVSDKDLVSILPLFPKNAIYYFCQPNIFRALPVAELKEKAIAYGLNGEAYKSVNEALRVAKLHAKLADFIYVGGSTFVVAEIL